MTITNMNKPAVGSTSWGSNVNDNFTDVENFAKGTETAQAIAVDNLKLDGNTLSSTDTNGNINIAPDGTGSLTVSSDFKINSDSKKMFLGAGDDASIYYDGANMIIDPAEVGSGAIVIGVAGDSDTIKKADATADTNGDDLIFEGSDGGAHSSNNPRGGDIVVKPGFAGGGPGREGVFSVQAADPTTTEVGAVLYPAAMSNGEKLSLQIGDNADPDSNRGYRLTMNRVSTSTRAFQIFYTNGGTETQQLRIENDDALVRIGTTQAAPEAKLHVEGGILSQSSTGTSIVLRRQDSSVYADNLLGQISFAHTEDSPTSIAAQIRGVADGTSGSGDYPGRIEFLTVANGSSTLTESFRIKSNQNIVMADGTDIEVNTSTGTQIATGTTQKLGFFGATPVAQQSHISDPSGGGTQDAEARTAINSILSLLETFGFTASS